MNDQDKYFIGSYVERLCGGSIYVPDDKAGAYEHYVRNIWMQFCIDTGVAVIPSMNGLVYALQKAFDYPLTVQSNGHCTTVATENTTWYFSKIQYGILIAPVPRFSIPRYHSHIRREMNIQKTSESIADVIKEFDGFLPVIELLIEEMHKENEKEKMHHQLMVTTAKGILDTLISEGRITLDRYPEIEQTFTGEFIRFNFWGSEIPNFGCRLKNLEQELIERFGNR